MAGWVTRLGGEIGRRGWVVDLVADRVEDLVEDLVADRVADRVTDRVTDWMAWLGSKLCGR